MLCAAIGAALSGLVFFVLHVTGSGSFPRPLTAAEEKDCLERMQRGDASGKAELIEHNLRLVAHIIKKYYSNSAEQDDLISIGTIGLIKAVNTFDSSKGIRLSSYAARCIENALLTLRNHLSADCLFFLQDRLRNVFFLFRWAGKTTQIIHSRFRMHICGPKA